MSAQRGLDVLAALVDEPQGPDVARPALHHQVDHHDDGHRGGQYPERQVREARTHQRHAGLVLDQPVDGADEAVEHPHHHGVDVHHAVDVEVEHAEQEVRRQELPCREQAEDHLRQEQHHGHGEVFHREALCDGQLAARGS